MIISKNSSQLLVFGFPLLIILGMILLARSVWFQQNPEALSIGITMDLILTTPLVYFLLIRKKNIPKITVVPVFILGIVICSLIIPTENQSLLEWVKTWVFPLVELGVVVFIIYKVRTTLKIYKSYSSDNLDFFEVLKKTCKEVVPNKFATFLAMEIAVFYYGFIYWKKRVINENEYTYHKNSGIIGLLLGLLLIVSVETYVLHVLLLKWSHIAAWIASGVSIYSGIQVLGFLKSITKRPIVIANQKLYLRYGILSEAIVDIDNIESIEITSKDIEFDKETRKLSPLGELDQHNVLISLKNEDVLQGFYGIKRSYKRLAVFIDEKEQFKTELESRMNLD